MKKYLIDVYVADDHAMFCEGLAEAINRSDLARVSRQFNTLPACAASLKERCPDVLLLDLSMPGDDGVAFCRQVVSDYPRMKVVVVTVHDEYALIRRVLDSGAHGYVLKLSPVDVLVNAIVTVWRGGRFIAPEVEDIIQRSEPKAVHITPAEQNVLRLICDGLTNTEIAARLGLTVETAGWYRKHLLAKCEARNTAELVRKALREHLI